MNDRRFFNLHLSLGIKVGQQLFPERWAGCNMGRRRRRRYDQCDNVTLALQWDLRRLAISKRARDFLTRLTPAYFANRRVIWFTARHKAALQLRRPSGKIGVTTKLQNIHSDTSSPPLVINYAMASVRQLMHRSLILSSKTPSTSLFNESLSLRTFSRNLSSYSNSFRRNGILGVPCTRYDARGCKA